MSRGGTSVEEDEEVTKYTQTQIDDDF